MRWTWDLNKENEKKNYGYKMYSRIVSFNLIELVIA